MASIDVLATLGEDALANHYMITMPATKIGESTVALAMRILTVNIPDRTIETYEITRRGRTMARPNGITSQSREVTFSFRSDKYFSCYKSLMNWLNFVQDNQTMAMASDSGALGIGGESEYRADLEISAIVGLNNDTPISTWSIQGAYPTSISGIEFNEESGDPLTCDVTLDCMNIVFPQA